MNAAEAYADRAKDIRNRPTIDHADVVALNFVRSSPPCVFRRHFRQGLRSHIMEILDPADVRREQEGVSIGESRHFPRARPRRMLRIFRSRLKTLAHALNEIGRVKLVERYLAPDFMATSVECIVGYRYAEGMDLLLCGFQEYVDGEIVDPWSILEASELLPSIYDALTGRGEASTPPKSVWLASARHRASLFVANLKRMVLESGYIPDLAGAGNLIITVDGTIRLVDINNISRVRVDNTIHLDEKGYPVCDKSFEALAILEEKILCRSIDLKERLYAHFLDPARRRAVAAQERAFWEGRRWDES